MGKFLKIFTTISGISGILGFLVLCIFFVLLMKSCEGKYKNQDGKMYYSYVPNENDKLKYEVEGADIKSFKVLKSSNSIGKIYAIDKNYAYWRGYVIENADIKTFKPIDGDYSIDSKRIFKGNKLFSTADPKTFRILADEYVLDSDSVYFKGKAILMADSKTFTTIGHYYAKDENAVYDCGEILSEISDPATFRLLAKPEREKKTNNWIGVIWAVVVGVKTPVSYLKYWGCDKDYYYYRGSRINSVDYSTFTLLDDGRGYARDQYHIFYCASLPLRIFIVEGADVETFEILNKDRNFAKDKYNYYYEGEQVSYDYAVSKRLITKLN